MASCSSFWIRTWCEAAKPMIKQEITRIEESLMAAKIEAVVAPRRMAEMAWMMVKVAEERGLIRINQTE